MTKTEFEGIIEKMSGESDLVRQYFAGVLNSGAGWSGPAWNIPESPAEAMQLAFEIEAGCFNGFSADPVFIEGRVFISPD